MAGIDEKFYLVFAGEVHYPAGGADDFVGTFQTKQEAESAAAKEKADHRFTWAHIAEFDPLAGTLTTI